MKGKAQISRISTTAAISYCETINLIPQENKKIIESIAGIGEKIRQMMRDYDPQRKSLVKLNENVNQLKSSFQKAEKTYDFYQDEERVLKNEFIQNSQQYEDCLIAENNSKTKCSTALESKSKSQKKWARYKVNHVRPAFFTLIDAQAEFEKAERKHMRETTKLNELLKPLFALKEDLQVVESDLSTRYQEYAKLRALDGQITYEVNWSTLLNEYQDLNPTSTLSFVKIPVIDAQVFATAFVDSKKAGSGVPVLYHAEIPGMEPSGFKNTKESKISLVDDIPTTNQSTALGIGDSSISGHIVLSAMGACRYFPEGTNTKREAITQQELSAYMVMNARYEFPVKARRKYIATYNLGQMMTRIQKKTKKGGFFSPEYIDQLTESNSSKDWFKIKFDADDPEFVMSATMQDKITKEVKTSLIERALENLAVMTYGPKAVPPSIPKMPESGVSVAGNGLSKVCGFHLYCHGSAFFLKTLDSIFGNSKAISSFVKHNSTWSEDNVDQVSILRRYTSLTFSK